MESWAPVILTPLITAISTLFWLYIKELRNQISEKNNRIAMLEEAVAQHTDTIAAVSETQDRMVGMLQTILQRFGGPQ